MLEASLEFGRQHVQLAAKSHAHGQESTSVHDIINAIASGELASITSYNTHLIGNIGITYRYHSQFKATLPLLAALFRNLDESAFPLAVNPMCSMLALYSTDGIKCKPAIEAATAAAIQAMGIEHFWEVVPLELDSPDANGEFPRAWLLPVMQTSISHARVGLRANKTFIILTFDVVGFLCLHCPAPC